MELLEIEVFPLQPSQFASAEPGWHVEKQHGPFPDTKTCQKQLHLLDFENVMCAFSFCGDAEARLVSRARCARRVRGRRVLALACEPRLIIQLSCGCQILVLRTGLRPKSNRRWMSTRRGCQ